MKKHIAPGGSFKKKEVLTALVFLLPLLFGLVTFFLIPVTKSFLFSISEVTASPEGYRYRIRGLQAFDEALRRNNDYLKTVVSVILKMALQVPLIVFFSFFMASLLSQRFRGRTLFRVILFVPVIITMTASQENVLEMQMSGFSGYKDAFSGAPEQFTLQIANYLKDIGFGEQLTNQVVSVADAVYSVINLSGIQILVLLTGMQSISISLYEAARAEGGTPWEIFWKITFPMVSPLVLICIIYSIIDSFTASGNPVMGLIEVTAFTKQNFSLSSAMSWIYFFFIALLLGIISFISKKLVFNYDD